MTRCSVKEWPWRRGAACASKRAAIARCSTACLVVGDTFWLTSPLHPISSAGSASGKDRNCSSVSGQFVIVADISGPEGSVALNSSGPRVTFGANSVGEQVAYDQDGEDREC